MRVLDLFCGLGGASEGYHRAGFEVTGVDAVDQPDYPFSFYKGDALEVLMDLPLWRFDLIHASPPCAAYTSIGKQNAVRGIGQEHPRLYEATRDILNSLGIPYVIENPAARADIVYCGEMFGLGVLRHRRFELGGWFMVPPEHKPHRGLVRGWNHGTYQDGPYVAIYGSGGGKASLEEAKIAMDIPWATDIKQLTQAIPPAYTEDAGRAFGGKP